MDRFKHIYQERDKFIDILALETDRGKCLTSSSYFESQLGHLIAKKLVGNDKKKQKLFDFNGPLGTFSSRIEMAFYLGLIGKEVKRDLHMLRKIRNKFAHSYSIVSFQEQPIFNLIGEFYYNYLDKEKDDIEIKFLSAVSGLFTIIKLAEKETIKLEEAEDIEFNAKMKKYVEHLRNEIQK